VLDSYPISTFFSSFIQFHFTPFLKRCQSPSPVRFRRTPKGDWPHTSFSATQFPRSHTIRASKSLCLLFELFLSGPLPWASLKVNLSPSLSRNISIPHFVSNRRLFRFPSICPLQCGHAFFLPTPPPPPPTPQPPSPPPPPPHPPHPPNHRTKTFIAPEPGPAIPSSFIAPFPFRQSSFSYRDPAR